MYNSYTFWCKIRRFGPFFKKSMRVSLFEKMYESVTFWKEVWFSNLWNWQIILFPKKVWEYTIFKKSMNCHFCVGFCPIIHFPKRYDLTNLDVEMTNVTFDMAQISFITQWKPLRVAGRAGRTSVIVPARVTVVTSIQMTYQLTGKRIATATLQPTWTAWSWTRTTNARLRPARTTAVLGINEMWKIRLDVSLHKSKRNTVYLCLKKCHCTK